MRLGPASAEGTGTELVWRVPSRGTGKIS
jgi:hypothetical protein